MLGELKHGELKPRGFPPACYSSQAACETGDRPRDGARSALAEGSCLQRWRLCSQPGHRSPGWGSAAGLALLSAALGQQQLNLHSICFLCKGKSSLTALPGLSGVGEDAMLEHKPMEKRGAYRGTVSPGTPTLIPNGCTNAS